MIERHSLKSSLPAVLDLKEYSGYVPDAINEIYTAGGIGLLRKPIPL